METGQEYIGNQNSHEIFSELLRSKVSSGKIGQWEKIKRRFNHE
jgi:hypothetical protein